jgi:hypothetical protein
VPILWHAQTIRFFVFAVGRNVIVKPQRGFEVALGSPPPAVPADVTDAAGQRVFPA